ncbi:MAG: serine/threonine-protein phosphatase, partial [Deinococcales bacterium]|nr:serine/threonine-protein phosphatase [Chitinophagaceae bacterium]
MTVNTFSLNKIGGRKNVEDAIMPKQFNPQDPKLFIVCDGVGGSSFGEVASDLAVISFYETFKKQPIAKEADFEKILHQSLAFFRQKVNEFVATNPEAANTSTTLTLLTLQNDKAYVAWCGDSRIFQLRNGKPIYKSKDHSLVAELTAQGVITEAEAEKHPQRNIITRSLNSQTKPTDIEYAVLTDIQTNDWFLLCTDGLMEQFTENLFSVVLNKYDSKTKYDDIIENICFGKTKDNYSMYLVHITAAAATSNFKKIILPLIVVILAVGGWLAYSKFLKPTTQPVNFKVADTIKLSIPKKDYVDKDTVKSIMIKTHDSDST